MTAPTLAELTDMSTDAMLAPRSVESPAGARQRAEYAPRERKIRVRTARTVTAGDTLVHEDRSTSTVTRVERVGSDVRLVYATGSLTIAARARVTVWA